MLAELLSRFSYAAVLVGAFAEGELVLLAAGALARTGRLSPTLVALAGCAGSVAWSQVWCRIGRSAGQGLLNRYPSWRGRVERVESWLSRRGVWLFLVWRFLPGMGAVFPATIGASGLSLVRFAFLDAWGALLWSSGFTAAGFGALTFVQRVQQDGVGAETVVLGLVLLGLGLLGWVALGTTKRSPSATDRLLIITADDFGLTTAVNEAIEIAHREGVLTTTSLMVGERYSDDAVLRARRNPKLRVGLHIVVCEGSALQPSVSIPLLTNRRGQLYAPLAAIALFGFRVFRRSFRRQLETEIRSQFRAFAATGLELDHVNAHNNMQLHPAVLPILLRVAREYGARAIRIPFEPLVPSWQATQSRPLLRLCVCLAMGTWARAVGFWVRQAGFLSNDYVFGVVDCGVIDERLLSGFICALPSGLSEIHCHPATHSCAKLAKVAPNHRPSAELAALLSPAVRSLLTNSGVHLMEGFAEASEVRGLP